MKLLAVMILVCAVGVGISAVTRYQARFLQKHLTVLFFDIGQGDASLVVFPGGHTLMIDAGGGFGDTTIAKNEILPELARRGILTIDDAVMSHPDQDHGYGFTTLLSEFRVRRLWYSGDLESQFPPKPLFVRLRDLAIRRAIALRPVKTTQVEIVNGVTWERWPSRGRAKNDWALLSRFEFGGCQVLFTADIESDGEKKLISKKSHPNTLLKVAHHGSKTSSTEAFLAWAKPRWSVLSLGHRNQYGHPHPSVLRRLHRFQTQIFRTDFHGFVEFRISEKGQVECLTAEGSCGIASCR